MAKSSFKKFLDAGIQLTEMSRERAESIVRSLVKSGDVRAKDAEQTIQALIDRGRDTTERLAAGVQAEVAKQVAVMQAQFQELEARIESLVRGGQPAAKSSTSTAARTTNATTKRATAEQAPPKQTAARKAPAAKKQTAARKATGAKKAPAAKKQTAARKRAAKKAIAKKAVANKTSTKRGTGTSGGATIRATRPG